MADRWPLVHTYSVYTILTVQFTSRHFHPFAELIFLTKLTEMCHVRSSRTGLHQQSHMFSAFKHRRIQRGFMGSTVSVLYQGFVLIFFLLLSLNRLFFSTTLCFRCHSKLTTPSIYSLHPLEPLT